MLHNLCHIVRYLHFSTWKYANDYLHFPLLAISEIFTFSDYLYFHASHKHIQKFDCWSPLFVHKKKL